MCSICIFMPLVYINRNFTTSTADIANSRTFIYIHESALTCNVVDVPRSAKSGAAAGGRVAIAALCDQNLHLT
jgi:hypothetical protein